MKKKRITGSGNFSKGILMGVVFAVVISIIGAMVLAWLVSTERIGESKMEIGCFAVQLLSAVVGCLIAFGIIRQKRLQICGVVLGSYFAVMLAVALAFGSGFDGVGKGAAAVLLGGGITALLGFMGNGSGVRKRKFKQFR